MRKPELGLALVVGAVVVVAIVVVATSAPGAAFPVGSALAIGAIFGAVALAGLVETREVRSAAPAAAEAPDVVAEIPAPLVPFSLWASAGMGSCPLGYESGDVWAVNGSGRLHRPLCPPAVVAARLLTSTWTEAAIEPTPGKMAQCRCPWARASLTFEAHAAQTA